MNVLTNVQLANIIVWAIASGFAIGILTKLATDWAKRRSRL